MSKELIYKLLLFTGLIPASILVCFSFLGLYNVITLNVLNFRNIITLTSLSLGIIGFIGLNTSFVVPKKAKLNFILLLLGIIGFSMFLSFEGGIAGWKWFVTIEEPDEWFLLGWPVIIAIVGLIVNFRAILKRKNA